MDRFLHSVIPCNRIVRGTITPRGKRFWCFAKIEPVLNRNQVSIPTPTRFPILQMKLLATPPLFVRSPPCSTSVYPTNRNHWPPSICPIKQNCSLLFDVSTKRNNSSTPIRPTQQNVRPPCLPKTWNCLSPPPPLYLPAST